MRTKTLLLTAALGIAGAATSMAQAVYSVNAVGYINVTAVSGFQLVANQLNATPNNRISSVIPTALQDSQILKFANNNYTRDDFDTGSGGWIDAETLEPSVREIKPGEGFFLYSPASTTITLVGEVPQGATTVALAASQFSLISSVVPQDIDLTAANGFPTAQDMQYLSYNAATQSYNTRLDFDSGGWINSETLDPVAAPRPTVAQGFFIYNPGAATAWNRTFSVNP